MKDQLARATRILKSEEGKPRKAPPRGPRVPLSRIVKPSFHGVLRMPEGVSTSGDFVFRLLCRCYAVANDIREAPLIEVLWGFQQGGYPAAFCMEGLRNLCESGYLVLTDADCRVLDLTTVNDTTKVWYMLTDRFLDLLAGPGQEGFIPDVNFDTVRI